MKMFVVKKVFICLFLLFSGMDVIAQSISGKVTDEQGLPVEFANIVLLSPVDSSFVQGTVSDMNGHFELQVSTPRSYLMKVSSISYRTVYRNTSPGMAEDILLPSELVSLGEAVVTAKRPDYQIKDGTLVTRIENSVLSQSGTANDVLKNIPGVQGQEGEFKVFGKGVPLIYINGREIRDRSELDRLSSADIRQIEVITNPGARYGADVKSVIRIKTVKQAGEGLGIEVRSTWEQSLNTDLNEQLHLNYRHNNLDVFAQLQYTRTNSVLTQHVRQQVFVDTLWQQNNQMEEHTLSDNYLGELGMNYLFNDNHSLGVRYSMSVSPKNQTTSRTESDIFADTNFYDYLLSDGISRTARKPASHINTYYTGTMGKLTIDFNVDMLWSRINTDTKVNETSQTQESRIVHSSNRINNKLYAGKLVLSHPLSGGNLSFGSEFTCTRRTDLFMNPEEILPTTDSQINEDRISVFAEYSRSIRFAHLNAGLRYEHVSSEYAYDNLFPNLSLAKQFGKLQIQLGYTVKTKRPTYAQLSSNLTYINRFTFQGGSPALKPETIHDVTLSGNYDWLQCMISYQREKDAILYITEQYEKSPAITIISHRNFPRIDNLSAYLVASPKIGWWQPQYTIGIQKQWADIEYNGNKLSMNKPLFMASLNNGFQFPHGWTASVNTTFQGKGDFQNIYIYKNIFMMDVSITKSFFNDRLSVNLQGIDLTHGRKDGNQIYNKQMDLTVDNEVDSREIRLTLRYKFNAAKSNYKGKGAADEEIKRL